MNFTYKSFGSLFWGGQLDRINEGLIKLDGKEVEENPDFIYSNDSGGYGEAIKLKEKYPKSKLILNVLDVPSPYIGKNYNLQEMYAKLDKADAVTSISRFVQGQLLHYFNKISYVVYNPVKDVNPDLRLAGIKKYAFKAMMAGRLNDPYKRAKLSIDSLIMAGFDQKDVAIVGSENPGWGTYLGIVSNTKLNELFNSVDLVLMCSNFEGLGLIGCESMICGAVPIICADLPTVSEFYPREWWCHPSPECISMYIRKLTDNPDIMEFEKKKALAVGEIVKKFLSADAVARKILEVFRLKNSENDNGQLSQENL